MYKEQNGKPFVLELLYRFGTVFTLTVLVITLTGILIARYTPDAKEISTLFVLGSAGLPYSAILQLAFCDLILAAFSVLLFSERFLTKMRFMWRFIFLYLSTLFTVSIFSMVCGWFPANNPLSWIAFILWLAICIAFAYVLTRLKFKIENKKINRLLKDYKERHNMNSRNNVNLS
jgi:magnesium-transporting ATPase (P-type)